MSSPLIATLVCGQPRLEGVPLGPEGLADVFSDAFAGGEDAAAAVVARLSGPFAIGLVEPVRGRALIAVDRMARESLCYALSGGALRFDARADGLAARRDDLDLQALFSFAYFHCIPSPSTAFRGVHRLPPATMGWFEHGQLKLRRYWHPNFQPPTTRPDFGALRAEFQGLLRDAVRDALDGTRPACFLSGGTDSSTVAGLVTELSGQPAATYSIGFDAAGYDEMEYARIAARHYGTDHHEYYVTPEDLVRAIPAVAAHHDQPFGNSSALPAYCCALRARQDGVERLLAGDGGDELFGGNTRYAKQKVFDWYGRVPAGLRQGLVEPLVDGGWLDRIPVAKKAASYCRQARVPMPDRLQTYNLLERLGISTIFEPGFLHGIDPGEPVRQQQAVWHESEGATFVDRMLAFDWRYTLAENDLPKVRDSTSLAQVQVAYPLLDDRLIAFSERLPTDYKLRRLRLRWFFKEALRGYLPDAIITKPKHGFGLPFGVWAVRNEKLQKLLQDSLQSLSARGIVQPAFIRSLLDERMAEHAAYFGEMAWILMMLEQWLQHHAPDYRLPA